jgi:peptidyl-dipeptidase A
MTDTIRAAVDRLTEQVRELHIDFSLTSWTAATTGTPEALDAAAKSLAAWMRYWADPEQYRQYKAWDEDSAVGDDPLLKRTVHVLHLAFAENQRDPATIDEMTELQRVLDDAYTNFRAEVDGRRLTANDVDDILDHETDSDRRRAAWEAGKEIGPRVADSIRRLAELRNGGAHRMGYDNFHQMSLVLNEIDPGWLFGLLDDLSAKIDESFRRAKSEMDSELSQRFGVPVGDLMPWHYADPFFQRAPMLGDFDFDALFHNRDLVGLATKTYDGLGMDARDILGRSDLYEREGKDQHAFCTTIDREGDVRVLCNLKPSLRWMDTLLHELGHGVYDKYIPLEIPWLLRSPAHTLSTEAVAMLMGANVLDAEWHARILGSSAAEAERAGQIGQARFRLGELIFARWVMVVVNFERLMYEDPSRDLDALWWDLVQRYQLLNKPEGREHKPDWATKYHIALAPAYYQNYLLGRMMSLQWDGWLRRDVGGIVGRAGAGEFFRERVFALGASLPWNEGLEHATGEKLNPDYFVRQFAN